MTYSLMPTFFRLLNFGIIVFLVIYFYRRHGRKALKDMFARYEKKKRLLSAEVVALEERMKEQKKAFSEQQDLGIRLSRNIEKWKECVAYAILLRQQEKESIVLSLEQKADRVFHYIAWVHMRRECLAEAHSEAVQMLTAFYADQDHAQDYLKRILSCLKETSC